VNSQKPNSREALKSKLLNRLKAGSGSLVIATTMLTSPSIDAAKSASPVLQRANEVRTQMRAAIPPVEQNQEAPTQLAWWGNYWGPGRWGPWHPWWHNWPNWHNWHNWGNW
jgi:hypothetical protein